MNVKYWKAMRWFGLGLFIFGLFTLKEVSMGNIIVGYSSELSILGVTIMFMGDVYTKLSLDNDVSVVKEK